MCSGIDLRRRAGIKHRRVQSAFRQAGLADVRVPAAAFDRQGRRAIATRGCTRCRQAEADAGGLYAAKSHRLIPCADCALQPPAFAGVVGTVCRFCDHEHIPAYDETTGAGILRHIYLRTTAAGEIMVCPVINADGLPGGRAAEARLVDCLLAEQPPRSVSCSTSTAGIPTLCWVSNTGSCTDPAGSRTRCADCASGCRRGHSIRSTARAQSCCETAARMAEVRGGGRASGTSIAREPSDVSCYPDALQGDGRGDCSEAVACAEQNARPNAEAGGFRLMRRTFFLRRRGDAAALFAAADTGAAPARIS